MTEQSQSQKYRGRMVVPWMTVINTKKTESKQMMRFDGGGDTEHEGMAHLWTMSKWYLP